MSGRSVGAAVTALVAVTVVSTAGWIVLFALDVRDGVEGEPFTVTYLVTNLVPAVPFVVVGAIVATRRATNPIGWLLLALGPLFAIPQLLTAYAAYGLLTDHGSAPGARGIAIALNGFWIPGLFALVLVTLLFPNGHLVSPRWRHVVSLGVVSLAGLLVVAHLGPLDAPFDGVDNPLETGGSSIVTALIVAPVLAGVVPTIVLAAASVVLRFRRAHGDEREQLKWFMFAACVLPVCLVLHLIAETAVPRAVPAVETLFSIGVGFLPIAMAIAIFKFRLYEIDRIVSRTLVYGVLIAVLAAAYAGLVLAGQWLFSAFAGGSNLAIAVSTLVVAGLFQPLRRRVRHVVDRRFFRRRYDAQRTLELFGARLRSETDPATVVAALGAVAGDVMQPHHLTVWRRRAP